MERDSLEFDIVCVGGGIASLSTVLRLFKRIRQDRSTQEKPSVLVVDKAQNVGNHILSGAVMDPESLRELLSDEEFKAFPVESSVVSEAFYYLTRNGGIRLPWVPPMMQAEGFPILSLSAGVRYMGKLCEAEGAELQAGFSAVQLLENGGRIAGIQVGDKGLDKDGSKKPIYEAGPNVFAKIVVLGEGAFGKLTEKLIADRNLNGGRNSQTYALGIKEVLQIPSRPEQKGRIVHAFGYPLDYGTYGGGFVYGMSDTRVAVGMVTALDYRNPTLSPHENFRLFKLNPVIRPFIDGGKVVSYGAKILPEGGCHSAPGLVVDGAMIVGDGGGLVDSLRLKGIHIAIQSGIAAGDTLYECWKKRDYSLASLQAYPEKFRQMPGWQQMRRVRNVRAAFTHGSLPGVAAAGLSWATRGLIPPGRLSVGPDWKHLTPKAECRPWPRAPRPNDATRALQMDRLTDVFFSGTKHEEHQPCHLKILDAQTCRTCMDTFGAPCTLFCPAEVYTLSDDRTHIRIDPSNCLHCKTCQIKDPYQNIEWTLPEGGGGPQYKDT